MVGQLVVARRDGAVLFEPVEEPFDLVAFAIGGSVEAGLGWLIPTAGNDGPDAALAQRTADGAAAVAFVASQPVGAQPGPTRSSSFDGATVQQARQGELLMALPTGQGEDERLATPFGADVDFGGEATPAPAERLLGGPPLPPAACWWARTTEPSTKCSVQSRFPAASPWRWRSASARSQTPSCCQRMKRLYTVCQGPYWGGRSRQGAPVVNRQSMPFTTRRWSWLGRPRRGRAGGNSGANRSHWASVRSCRCWSIRPAYRHFADTP